METHHRKKLDIIVEAPLQRRVVALLEEQEVRGYTVMPCLAGKGADGTWQQGEISDAFSMRLIVVIAREEAARRIMEAAHELLRDYSAIITLSDVEVIRADHF
uniref:Nitrogen regulatory protein P-II n=1 Tax=Pelagibius litoralis TaxID=374515 RepID=A0A967CB05_9PROT|nr:DUF190 domain-containing protein [Pelagibius litoralis]NIA68023.1 DUF190 domain-containing protein [Pelagibius litoralis]